MTVHEQDINWYSLVYNLQSMFPYFAIAKANFFFLGVAVSPVFLGVTLAPFLSEDDTLAFFLGRDLELSSSP